MIYRKLYNKNRLYLRLYLTYMNILFQLCLTLSRVAACTEKSDLQNLWVEIGDHVEEISNFMKQFQVKYIHRI